MSFDPEIALKRIPGFKRRTQDYRTSTGTACLNSHYIQAPDTPPIELYGSKFSLNAHIYTEFDGPASPMGSPPAIIAQSVGLSVFPDDTFEGYEQLHTENPLYKNFGGIDPDKQIHSLKVLAALAQRIGAGEIIDTPLGKHLRIPLYSIRPDPIAEIERMVFTIEAIAATYKYGGKPLGDIKVPQWKLKAAPKTDDLKRADRLLKEIMTPDSVEMRAQQAQQTDTYGQDIKTLVRKYFLPGSFVSQAQHDLFKAELLKLFGITPEEFALQQAEG